MATANLYLLAVGPGSVSNGVDIVPGNALGAPDGTYTTGVRATSWTYRWLFQTLPNTTTTSSQTLTLRVRKSSGSGNPTLNSVNIYRNGASYATDLAGGAQTITSTTGTDIVCSLPTTGLGPGDAIELELVTTGQAGVPLAQRTHVQFDGATWAAVYDGSNGVVFAVESYGKDTASGSGRVKGFLTAYELFGKDGFAGTGAVSASKELRVTESYGPDTFEGSGSVYDWTDPSIVRQIDASQTTAAPTQAAVLKGLATVQAAQTTAAPSQAASASVLAVLNGTQTTAAPTQTSDFSSLNSINAAQTTQPPAQVATAAAVATIATTQTTAAPVQAAAIAVLAQVQAAQVTAAPTQAASIGAVASVAAAQSTTVPSQTATASSIATAQAAQVTAAPTQATALAILAVINAAQITVAPTQAFSGSIVLFDRDPSGRVARVPARNLYAAVAVQERAASVVVANRDARRPVQRNIAIVEV